MKSVRRNVGSGASAGRPPALLAAPGANPKTSPRTRRTFRLLAVLSPLILVCLVELGMRAAGYGYPTSFFLKVTRQGKVFLIENPRFGWRFFPPRLARTSQPFSVPAVKPANTLRIFVLGESAAMGDPEPAFGFSRQLEQMLRIRHPDKSFEVINVAMTAINSHVIREIARDCASEQGDCWVIYAGNNEVVGPYGAGTVFGKQAPPLFAVRLALLFKRTCIGQWLSSLGQKSGPSAEWEGMEMFLQQQVTRDDPRLARVYANFAANLESIVRLGKNSGAKVVLATVPVNLKDCPPFASKHRVDLSAPQLDQWQTRFASARAAETNGKFADALKGYASAGELDSKYAEVPYREGICSLVLSNASLAKEHLDEALELDALRFRADAQINAAIRRTAKTTGVSLVDAERQFAQASSPGLPGDELFYDHVHPNFHGNYLMASSVLPAVERELCGDDHATPPPGEDTIAARLAFTDFERRRVAGQMRARLQQPPFSTQSNFKERDQRWEKQISSITTPASQCLSTYKEAVSGSPGDWVLHANYARALEAAGTPSEASNQWAQVTDLIPQDPSAWFQLANLAYNRQDYPEAERLFEDVLARTPESTDAMNGLGLAAGARGATAEARAWFMKALQINPSFVPARINLAAILSHEGDPVGAASEYRKVLSTDTNNVAARINLAQLLLDARQTPEAIALLSNAVAINPDEPIAQYNLANALCSQEKYSESIPHYFAAVKARPDFAEARYNLGVELARAGRSKEALAQFREAVRLKPDFADAHFNYGVALARETRFPEAVREFRETLRLNPQHKAAQNSLRRALLLENQTEPGDKTK